MHNSPRRMKGANANRKCSTPRGLRRPRDGRRTERYGLSSVGTIELPLEWSRGDQYRSSGGRLPEKGLGARETGGGGASQPREPDGASVNDVNATIGEPAEATQHFKESWPVGAWRRCSGGPEGSRDEPALEAVEGVSREGWAQTSCESSSNHRVVLGTVAASAYLLAARLICFSCSSRSVRD